MQQGIGKRRALIFCGELRSFLSVLGSSAFDNPTGIGSLGCPSIGAFAGGALFSDRESPPTETINTPMFPSLSTKTSRQLFRQFFCPWCHRDRFSRTRLLCRAIKNCLAASRNRKSALLKAEKS
jgi:hypothetical protein